MIARDEENHRFDFDNNNTESLDRSDCKIKRGVLESTHIKIHLKLMNLQNERCTISDICNNIL